MEKGPVGPSMGRAMIEKKKKITIESLRKAIHKRAEEEEGDKGAKFEAVARRYERAVQKLIQEILTVVEQVPEFEIDLEDETEKFTSPAYPGQEIEIKDRKLKISLGEDFLLFDPSAKALAAALGQVEIIASKPIPFMIEKSLYLIPHQNDPQKVYWCYRAIENLGSKPILFTQEQLLKLLHTIFT